MITVKDSELTYDEEQRVYLNGQLFTGVAVLENRTGERTETQYVAGVANGESRTFFSNGAVKIICNYWTGSYDGKYEEFYECGAIKATGTYNTSCKIVMKTYAVDGTLLEEYDIRNDPKRINLLNNLRRVMRRGEPLFQELTS